MIGGLATSTRGLWFTRDAQGHGITFTKMDHKIREPIPHRDELPSVGAANNDQAYATSLVRVDPHRSQSAARALMLLEIVVTKGPIALGEAATATAMAPSTALRHLRALTEDGYLERDELGQFSVGPEFIRVALSAFNSGPHALLLAAAQPELELLVEATEESAYLAVRSGDTAVYVKSVESKRAIRHVGWVGRTVPLDITAVGKSLTGPARPAGTSPPIHMKTGIVEPDVTAITAPIYGTTGIVAALSLLGPSDRLVQPQLDKARNAVLNAATNISVRLTS